MEGQNLSFSQQIISRLEENFNRNITFLEEHYPPIFSMVCQKGKKNVELDVTPGGEIRLLCDSRVLEEYQFEKVKDQIEGFYRNPSRISKPLDDIFKFKRRCLHIDTLKEICSHSRKFSFRQDQCVFNKFRMPILMIFGIGTGFHIQAFTEISEIKHLILVEEDIELFKASLYVIDWKKILSGFQGEERKIYLFINDDKDKLVNDILHAVMDSHPMFASLGYFFNISQSPLFEQVLDELANKQFLMYHGWGFFDDEMCSAVQTLVKIKKKVPVFSGKYAQPKGSVAFVVGSGPSLDRSIELIRKYQENAVIFSCGTALKIFEREGIIPDFHVELERPELTYKVLTEGLPLSFLKKLYLIGSNPLYPRVMDLMDKKMMFLKDQDAGTIFFKNFDYPILFLTSPTVTNAALSVALASGFENIYFFGVDLGWRDPERHHSTKSAYYDKSHFLSKASLEYDWVEEDDLGKLYTTSIFSWTRNSIEILLSKCTDRRFFQVGNGARIKGAERILSGDLELAEKCGSKPECIEILRRNANAEYARRIKPRKILKRSGKYFEKITDFILNYLRNKKIKTREDFISFACERHSRLLKLQEEDFFTFILLRGTLWHIENYIYIISHQITDDGDMERFLEGALEIYKEFILKARKIFQGLLEYSSSKGTTDLPPHNEYTYYFLEKI